MTPLRFYQIIPLILFFNTTAIQPGISHYYLNIIFIVLKLEKEGYVGL